MKSSCCILLFLVGMLTVYVSAQSPYKRVCYYTNWAQYRPKEGKYVPEDMDPSHCSHLIFAFAKLNGNQLVAYEWNDESTEWMKGMYAKFNDVKVRNPGIKTLLAIGGWNMASKPFTALVATAANRQEFARTTVQFLRERNFDGLDLDWEYPANRGSPPEDRDRYTQLVMEVRSAFDNEARITRRTPLLLTSAVAAGKDKIDTAYDVPQICRDMDFISVMTYDLHGSWENRTGHNSPLFPHSGEHGDERFLNMDWAANYWVQMGCPKEKLVIGMGLYGRSFTLKDAYSNGLMAPVTGKGTPGKYTREGGFIAYYEICDMIQHGAQTYYIKEQEVPYLVVGDQWVGYDDADSLRIKVQWMKQNGFAGVMVWALDLDDFYNRCGQGRYPLMTTINQELTGNVGSGPVMSRPNRVHPDPVVPIQPRPATKRIPARQNNNNNNNGWQQAPNVPPTRPNTRPETTTSLSNNMITNPIDCPAGENKYFASTTSCDEYYICAAGQSFKFKCAPPLQWDSVNNYCDWPGNTQCNLAPSAPLPDPAPVISDPINEQPRIIPQRKIQPRTDSPAPRRPPTTKRTTSTTRVAPVFQATGDAALPTVNIRPPPQPSPEWTSWSMWIAEFWKALSSLGAPPPELITNFFKQHAAAQPGQDTQSYCTGKLDGIHPEPSDCSKYIDCVQGRAYVGSCPAGTAFDSTYGVCDYVHKVSRCSTPGI